VCQIDTPSDQSTSIGSELRNIENEFLKHDKALELVTDCSTATLCPFMSSPPLVFNYLSQNGGIFRKSLKVDVPLIFDEHPPALSTDVTALQAQAMELDASLDNLGIERPNDELCEPFFSNEFQAILEEKMSTLMNRIEQEQLDVVDATARIEIPVMDFSIPEPPWKAAEHTPIKRFRWLLVNHPSLFAMKPWLVDRRAEKQMGWNPFGRHIRRLNLNESLGVSDEELKDYMDEGKSTPGFTNGDCLAKRSALAFLRTDDDLDELDCPDAEEVMDEIHIAMPASAATGTLENMIKKRRLEMDESVLRHNPKKSKTSRLTAQQSGACAGSLFLDTKEADAGGKLLSRFVDLQMGKMNTTETSPFFGAPAKQITPALARPAKPSAAQIAPVEDQQGGPFRVPVKETIHEKLKRLRPTYPSMPALETRGRFVVSLGMDQKLGRRIAKLLPNVELLDRDFTVYNTYIWSPGSTERKEVASDLAFEADIIASPVTGILLTNWLKLRQKPMQGETPRLPQIRERVQRVSKLYERLIVLISEDNPDGEYVGELGPVHATAYNEFVSWTTTLDTSIVVYLVGGAFETLAQWTAALMCQFASSEAMEVHESLMLQETSWEVLLRRAGMNCYAAQVLVSALKAKFGDRGLLSFAQMSTNDRIAKFETVLGGKKLLARVSSVFAQSWV
jgi:hypothetical protein